MRRTALLIFLLLTGCAKPVDEFALPLTNAEIEFNLLAQESEILHRQKVDIVLMLLMSGITIAQFGISLTTKRLELTKAQTALALAQAKLDREPLPTITKVEANNDRGILVGYHRNKPIYAPKDYSIVVGGKSGSGKTTYVSAILKEINAKLVILDPHGTHPQGLVSRVPKGKILEIFKETELRNVIEQMNELYEQRRSLSDNEAVQSHESVILVIDEFLNILGQAARQGLRKEFLSMLSLILYSGRKYGISLMLISQAYRSSNMNDAFSPPSAPVQISLKSTERAFQLQAGKLDTDVGKLVIGLEKGQALVVIEGTPLICKMS